MNKRVCWLDIIDEDEASGDLGAVYKALRERDGYTQNLYRAFSRYPQATLSADQLYRDVLHAPDAPLPMWLSEMIGVQVAVLADCAYALVNHGANLVALHPDPARAEEMLEAMKRREWKAPMFDAREQAILAFGEKLALDPGALRERDLMVLRATALDDAEISQIVQVAANFAYWVRVINAFGISLGEEPVGRYS